jgi:hypothetical protein
MGVVITCQHKIYSPWYVGICTWFKILCECRKEFQDKKKTGNQKKPLIDVFFMHPL